MTARRSKETTDKKTYNKPTLRSFSLAADEVMAAGCKLAAGSNAVGQVAAPCTDPILAPCSGIGS